MSYSYYSCYCRECECMDLNDRSSYDRSKAYCSARREYINTNDRACSAYFQYAESRRTPSSPCYLTTIVSNILGMPDDGRALKELRHLRDDYMLNHPETYVSLIEYDIIGPRIANAIQNDPCKVGIATYVYKEHILPIVGKIENQKFEEAVNDYQLMTYELQNFYQIDSTINKKLDINVKTLGKARA